jgi:MFS family permease
MDNMGAVLGPMLALALAAVLGVRWTIGLSVVPGLLAACAISYAIRTAPRRAPSSRTPVRWRFRPLLAGRLGRLLGAIAAVECSHVAATLLILRATQVLLPRHGIAHATVIAVGLYAVYNAAATLAAMMSGYLADRLGPTRLLGTGTAVLGCAYLLFIVAGPSLVWLALAFTASGAAIGCIETSEHAAVARLAPTAARGSAFGLLAVVSAGGGLFASAIAGILWTVASPAVAFAYLTGWTVLAIIGLGLAHR